MTSSPFFTEEILDLFRLADAQAVSVMGTTSPNPPVGALIVDSQDRIIGRGATQPPGGAHAEVVAVQEAVEFLRSQSTTSRGEGLPPKGCRAIVTLEPCNHTGRTGPCAQILIDHGISRVDFLFADPHQQAAGGKHTLLNAGVEVHGPYLDFPLVGQDHTQVWALEPWLTSITKGRPHVVAKWAATVDGRIAAKDGSSQWITGATARQAVHEDRSRRDAIVVGSGTLVADNPRLTARDASGALVEPSRQPYRVVIGSTPVPPGAAIEGEDGLFIHCATRNLDEALRQLGERGITSVLVEGGPHLIDAFITAGLVDEIHAYIAPALLGGGLNPSAGSGGLTMADIQRFTPRTMEELHPDVRWILTRTTAVES